MIELTEVNKGEERSARVIISVINIASLHERGDGETGTAIRCGGAVIYVVESMDQILRACGSMPVRVAR